MIRKNYACLSLLLTFTILSLINGFAGGKPAALQSVNLAVTIESDINSTIFGDKLEYTNNSEGVSAQIDSTGQLAINFGQSQAINFNYSNRDIIDSCLAVSWPSTIAPGSACTNQLPSGSNFIGTSVTTYKDPLASLFIPIQNLPLNGSEKLGLLWKFPDPSITGAEWRTSFYAGLAMLTNSPAWAVQVTCTGTSTHTSTGTCIQWEVEPVVATSQSASQGPVALLNHYIPQQSKKGRPTQTDFPSGFYYMNFKLILNAIR